MKKIRAICLVISHLGFGWLSYRVWYALRRKLGLLRRATPPAAWEDFPSPALRLHFRETLKDPELLNSSSCIEEAEGILRGEFRLFSHQSVRAGFPPDWRRNQLSGEQVPGDVHWSQLRDFAFGDIKGVWELSRFPWAFALARAFVRTADPRYADGFWQLFEDWLRRNQPNLGPNWMCGQETTFRLIAAVFGAEIIGLPAAQRDGFARFVVASGHRIAANLKYALSQRNNHGISECVGLITAALLLPEYPESRGWLTRGLAELTAALEKLVYADGAFAQHSLIYHRVLLHDLCWCRRRLSASDISIPAGLDDAGNRALTFLTTLTDPQTGTAPLYGSNDGANVLPVSGTDYLDARPTLQMAAAVFQSALPLPAGPWDEAAAWFVRDWSLLRRVGWPAAGSLWHAPEGGCAQLTNRSDRLFLRCPTAFRHRPSQADMLHCDITHEGQRVALDGGSYSYNTHERFGVLSAARHHNVLTIDGQEPLQKLSRFLYLPWPHGSAATLGTNGFIASHDGYARLGVEWIREVRLRQPQGFIIRDQVKGAAGHRLLWHWRLANTTWEKSASGDSVELTAPFRYIVRWNRLPGENSRLIKADDSSAYGWWSPFYTGVQPSTALLIEIHAQGDVELVTEFHSPA